MNDNTSFNSVLAIDVVLHNILQYTDGPDLQNVICSNQFLHDFVVDKYFLRSRMQNQFTCEIPLHFMNNDTTTIDEMREWMFRKGASIPASDFWVVHMGDVHWKWHDDQNSKFGRVARLLNVCWTQVETSKRVKRGVYKVKWGLRRYTPYSRIENWKFLSQVEEGPTTEYCYSTKLLNKNPTDEWYELDVGQINLDQTSVVHLKIHDFSGTWKTGVDIGYVRFEQ